MKKALILLPAALICLSGCSTAERMNCLINQSTNSIYCNIEAVETSTQVIRHNRDLIDQSSRAIQENRRQLEQLH